MAIRTHRTTRAEGSRGGVHQPAVPGHACETVDAQALLPISVPEAVFGARLRDTGRAWVLELAGECDIAVADVLEAALGEASKAALDRQTGLVIDVRTDFLRRAVRWPRPEDLKGCSHDAGRCRRERETRIRPA